MEIDFNNHYIVGIIVFMLVLIFCKNLLECIDMGMQVFQKVCCGICEHCLCPCVHYGEKQVIYILSVSILIILSVGQPIFFICCKKIGDMIYSRPTDWTVNFLTLNVNSSSFEHTSHDTKNLNLNNISVFQQQYTHKVEVNVNEVDALFVLMPFALFAASATWTWVSLKHVGFFDSDPNWDSSLFEDARMQMYEMLYALECFGLTVVLFSNTADPALFNYTIVSAIVCTFIVMYFASEARHASSSNHINSWMNMLMFSCLCMLTTIFVSQHWQGCGTKRGISILTALGLPMLAMIQMHGTQDVTAGYVILKRTIYSIIFSVYFMITLMLDSNSVCK